MVEKLSGGQAQRLSIACALVHEPELVFLDEPTAALDPQARRNLWDVLRAINTDGRTIVLTTHYMDEAEILCDRVAIMDRGKILRSGPPATLVRDLNASARVSVASGAISVEDARTLPGADDVTDDDVSLAIATHDAATVVKALAERGALDGVQIKGATLEDVFLDLTGREYRA
jgi:ABC-2 type transport system ATP-binding protein